MNNKRFSWKNFYSPTLKFKLEREISWWQTHKLIILIIIEWTARLRLEIYLETGWDVQTCYSHHTEIWNTYAMKSSLFSCGVMFTGQTHLNKGHFPYNLDNTQTKHWALLNFRSEINIATLNNALQNARQSRNDFFSVLSAHLTLTSACLKDVKKNQTRQLTNRPAL